MLINFLQNLYKKPVEYQLVWLYILGHIQDGKTIRLKLKKLNKEFNYPKSKFYRILRFGLSYFDNNSIGVFIEQKYGSLYIEVIRKKNNAEEEKKDKANINESISQIINYLNEKTNKSFSLKGKQTIRYINARLKEGFTINDFKKVIDIKVEKWLNTDMEDYLRPVTLFSTKFESYVNEKPTKKQRNDRFAKTQSAISEAEQQDWVYKE